MYSKIVKYDMIRTQGENKYENSWRRVERKKLLY